MKQRFFLSLLLAGLLFIAAPCRPALAQVFEPSFEEGMAAFNYGDNQLALKHFLRLANDGDSRAQYYLAYMMDSGLGMGKDVYGASSWYKKSAAQNYLPAMVYLGYIYSAGHGVTQDDKQAFKWYTAAAQMGDPIAQNNLATMLRAGRPYQADKKLAAQWFLQSAMQGNMRAQYNIANMYRTADGIGRNSAEALKWYTYAANQGDMYAQYALGYMHLGLGKEAAAKAAAAKQTLDLETDKTTAKAKDAQQVMDAATSDKEQSMQQGLEWFRRAAEQGHAAAQLAIARMYENGDGGPDKGVDDAVIWYLHAAEAGKGEAMRRLGLLYQGEITDWKGNHLPQDYKQALKWLKKAAEEKDDRVAMLELGKMYAEGRGVNSDSQRGCKWYEYAGETGNPEGMMLVANCYKEGIGFPKDLRLAYKWFLLAANAYKKVGDGDGMVTAVKNKTALVSQLSPYDRGQTDQEVEYWRPTVHGGPAAKKERPLFYDDK
jgi:uncharacterized protein